MSATNGAGATARKNAQRERHARPVLQRTCETRSYAHGEDAHASHAASHASHASHAASH